VLGWCERQGVDCVAMSPAFLAARDAQARLHFVHDGHWTAAGHALAADTMAAFLHKAVGPPVQYAEDS
jgi:hypothetical protein